MKKLSYLLMFGLVATMGLTSCSDDDFDSKYANPGKTNTVTCDKLMTGVFYEGTTSNVRYGMTGYWRLFTFDTQFLGRLANTYGYTSGKDAYAGLAESYNNNRWTTFYRMLTQYKLLENVYNNEDEANQKKDKIFLYCSKIWMYDQLQQMVDLWGDVPYSEACTTQINNDVTTAYAPYDDAATLYKMMMTDLLTMAKEMKDMTLDNDVVNKMNKQDFVNKGSKDLWVKYATGLCARIAMRCATQGTLAQEGQSVLKQLYSGSYDLVSGNEDEVLINIGTASGDFDFVEGGAFGLKDGWESWTHSCNTASQTMLDLMDANSANEDPRLKVMFAYNNPDGLYRGKSPFEVPSVQSALTDSTNYYSCLDSVTFSRNHGYLDPKMTAAEVDLTHAEAIARGYVAGDAKALFVKGVTESINYYYRLNAASDFGPAEMKPDSATIAAYVESKWNAANPVKCIAEQYWIHMGIGSTVQSLMNVRRTGYPELTFVDYTNAQVDCPVPVDRLKYPSGEVMNNPVNLADELNKNFGGEDSNYKPIFWAKESKSWFKLISEPK